MDVVRRNVRKALGCEGILAQVHEAKPVPLSCIRVLGHRIKVRLGQIAGCDASTLGRAELPDGFPGLHALGPGRRLGHGVKGCGLLAANRHAHNCAHRISPEFQRTPCGVEGLDDMGTFMGKAWARVKGV
jgi:hypothetical protein